MDVIRYIIRISLFIVGFIISLLSPHIGVILALSMVIDGDIDNDIGLGILSGLFIRDSIISRLEEVRVTCECKEGD